MSNQLRPSSTHGTETHRVETHGTHSAGTHTKLPGNFHHMTVRMTGTVSHTGYAADRFAHDIFVQMLYKYPHADSIKGELRNLVFLHGHNLDLLAEAIHWRAIFGQPLSSLNKTQILFRLLRALDSFEDDVEYVKDLLIDVSKTVHVVDLDKHTNTSKTLHDKSASTSGGSAVSSDSVSCRNLD